MRQNRPGFLAKAPSRTHHWLRLGRLAWSGLWVGSRPRDRLGDAAPDPTTSALSDAVGGSIMNARQFVRQMIWAPQLSRVAQLDQRTAFPDQCLRSAEAERR